MILRPEELALAREYAGRTTAEALTREQTKLIMDRGRQLFHWYKDHVVLHYAINIGVLTLLLGGDYLILLHLPRLLLDEGVSHSWSQVLVASLVCGGLHSYLVYSLSVFSMHEGAAHGIVFPGTHPASRALNWFANNLCRIGAAEPQYFAEHHMSHHSKFGTENDGEFLNFVQPRRLWLSLLPFAAFVNYTDFIAHRPSGYTRGRIMSAVVSLSYHGAYGLVMADRFGAVLPLLSFVLFLPHL